MIVRRSTLERIEADLREEIVELEAERNDYANRLDMCQQERDEARAAYRQLLADLGAFGVDGRARFSWAVTPRTIQRSRDLNGVVEMVRKG